VTPPHSADEHNIGGEDRRLGQIATGERSASSIGESEKAVKEPV
jgi:hypothetical protein